MLRPVQEAFSPDELLRAWSQIRHYAKTEDAALDPYEAFLFEQHLDCNVTLLADEASEGYRFGPFVGIYVPKAGSDRIKVWAASEDAVVAQALMNVIGTELESRMSGNSFGNRLDSDPSSSNVIFRPWLDAYDLYRRAIRSLLKTAPSHYYRTTDLSNFYPSVMVDKLLERLKPLVEEPYYFNLVDQLVHYTWGIPEGGTQIIPGAGLPQGPAFSAVLANFYLKSLDTWLEQRTKGFARYVDDMCIVFESEEHAEALWDELGTFVGGLGLKFSAEKTSQAVPVTNGIPARDLLERIRYEDNDRNLFARVDHLSSEDKQAVAEQLRDQFFNTSNVVTLVDAAKRLNYLFKTQRRLLEGENPEQIRQTLADIALVLSSGPLKPSTIRGLLSQVLDHSKGDLPDDFKEIIRRAHPFVKVLFLETVRGLAKLPPRLRTFVREFCGDHYDSQVRAAAFYTLFDRGASVDANWLAQHLSTSNDFVLARSLLCLLNTKIGNDQLVQILVDYVARPSSMVVASVLYILANGNLSQTEVELVLDCINPEGLSRPSVISPFLYICMRYKQIDRLAAFANLHPEFTNLGEAARAVLSKLKAEVLAGGKGISATVFWTLWSVRESLSAALKTDFQADLDYCIKATATPTGGPIPPDIARILSTVATGNVATPFPTLTVHPILKLLEDKDRKYSVVNAGTPNEQIVEVVTRRKLQENGKTGVWVVNAYSSLPEEVRCQFEYSEAGGVLRIHYHVPTGYRLLASTNITDDQVSLRIVRQLAILGDQGYVLPPLDPFHVMVNDEGRVKLVGFTSCAGVQKFTSVSGRSEILQGGVTGAYCLGLLLFSVVSRKCPFVSLKELESASFEEVKERGRWARLSDLGEFRDRPHIRWIMDKATRRDWQDRYQNFSILASDLNFALKFVGSEEERKSPIEVLSEQQWAEVNAKSIHLRHFLLSKALAARGALIHARELHDEVVNFLTDKRLALTSGFLALTSSHSNRNHGPIGQVYQFARRVQSFVALGGDALGGTAWEACCRASAYVAFRIDLARVLQGLMAKAKLGNPSWSVEIIGEQLPTTLSEDTVSVLPKFMGNWLDEVSVPSSVILSLASKLRSDPTPGEILTSDVTELWLLLAVLMCQEVQFSNGSSVTVVEGEGLVGKPEAPVDLVLQRVLVVAESESSLFGYQGIFPTIDWFQDAASLLSGVNVTRRRARRLKRPMDARDRKGVLSYGPYGLGKLKFDFEQLSAELHDIHRHYRTGTLVEADTILASGGPAVTSVLFAPRDLHLVTQQLGLDWKHWAEIPWVRVGIQFLTATVIYVLVISNLRLDHKEWVMLIPGGFLVNTLTSAVWELVFYRRP